MKFSIITASFNPGEKLITTIKSILEQEFQDFEIIVKDGGSKDGSIKNLRREETVKRAVEEEKLKLAIQADRNVYDGMNQALGICRGEYILFLNCGDKLHDRKVLGKVAEETERKVSKKEIEYAGGDEGGTPEKAAKKKEIDGKVNCTGDVPVIYYGNTYCIRTGAMVHSAPNITGFTCYRNIPCHQSCFYDRRLFQDKKYDTDLKIRADYDHFLWCFYRGGAKFRYMDLVTADYEGGGISEAKENRKIDRAEHELVIRRYMRRGEILRYKGIMLLTLAPLRRWIAESSRFSGVYHRLKNFIYRK